MLRHNLILPGYYSGPLGTNNANIRPISGVTSTPSVVGSTIIATIAIFTSGSPMPQVLADSRQQATAVFAANIIAGADTVLQAASFDGSPAVIVCQCNTGGYISAIIYGFVQRDKYGRSSQNSTTGFLYIDTTGTAPTSAILNFNILVSKGVIAGLTSTTAADTARSVTFPFVPRRCIFVAAGINDVGTANSCTWSGTASNVSELTDAALGTARHSIASTQNFAFQAEGSGATVISTWAVSSVNGVSLACGIFGLDSH